MLSNYVAFRYAILNSNASISSNHINSDVVTIQHSIDDGDDVDIIIQQPSQQSKRSDGRHNDEIRPLSSQVEVLPAVHGSSFFKRGDTHVSKEDDDDNDDDDDIVAIQSG